MQCVLSEQLPTLTQLFFDQGRAKSRLCLGFHDGRIAADPQGDSVQMSSPSSEGRGRMGMRTFSGVGTHSHADLLRGLPGCSHGGALRPWGATGGQAHTDCPRGWLQHTSSAPRDTVLKGDRVAGAEWPVLWVWRAGTLGKVFMAALTASASPG